MLYLSSAPRGLRIVRLKNIATKDVESATPSPTTAVLSLPHVHTLICHTNLLDEVSFARLARIMPNVYRLDHRITRDTEVLLHYVTFGTRLTELTVHLKTQTPMFCAMVAKLAPSLRRYTSRGGKICEMLFNADWGVVEYINMVCWTGCTTVKVDKMRESLVRLVAARPGAKIMISVEKCMELVWWADGATHVATVLQFGALCWRRV